MNQSTFRPRAAPRAPAASEALQARYALRVTARLNERAAEVTPDIAERLRFAREQALTRAQVARRVQGAGSVVLQRDGSGVLGGGWWVRIGAVLPAIALAAGLFLIQRWQDNSQIAAAAEVDAALLSDDLPPKAYSDAGFAEFLKTPGE